MTAEELYEFVNIAIEDHGPRSEIMIRIMGADYTIVRVINEGRNAILVSEIED